ncbi:hypothetical protein ZOSMA_120G00590 [Zostera marina]|uniref:Uncharacterized protein n=1 Tax=Zostera marina TaxID=29655 RepID=A0A0K9Q0X2_ZOSMR|nr:hypothetical protein ZOSMA_120G00590 [Zostera marina]
MTQIDESATILPPPLPPLPPPPEKTAEEDPDLPAESFYVSVTDEIDWIDRNAVYERDDSTKGTTNPKSQQHNNNATNTSISNSQRFSGNLKALGLPNTNHVPRRSSPRSKNKIRTKSFAKNSGSDGASEPVSPKVSCIGRVMSKKERHRHCNRSRQDPPAQGFWLCCCCGR